MRLVFFFFTALLTPTVLLCAPAPFVCVVVLFLSIVNTRILCILLMFMVIMNAHHEKAARFQTTTSPSREVTFPYHTRTIPTHDVEMHVFHAITVYHWQSVVAQQ